VDRGYAAPSPAQAVEDRTGVNAFQADFDKGPAPRVAEAEGDEKRVAAFQVHHGGLSAFRADCENSLPLRTAETEEDGMRVVAFQVDDDRAPAPRVAEAEGERMRAAAFRSDCDHV
jgi:hypothetical protein